MGTITIHQMVRGAHLFIVATLYAVVASQLDEAPNLGETEQWGFGGLRTYGAALLRAMHSPEASCVVSQGHFTSWCQVSKSLEKRRASCSRLSCLRRSGEWTAPMGGAAT